MKSIEKLLSVLMCAFLVIALVSCAGTEDPANPVPNTDGTQQEHTHIWEVASTTATFFESGTMTIRCSCGEEETIDVGPLFSVPSTQDGIPLTSVAAGDIVYFGIYPQSAAEETPTFTETPSGSGDPMGPSIRGAFIGGPGIGIPGIGGRFGNPYNLADDGKYYKSYRDGPEDDLQFFTVEPVAWRVITADYDSEFEDEDGGVLLLSEKVLSAGLPFSGTENYCDRFLGEAFPQNAMPVYRSAAPESVTLGNMAFLLEKSELETMWPDGDYRKTGTDYAAVSVGETPVSEDGYYAWWIEKDWDTWDYQYVTASGEISVVEDENDPDLYYYFQCGIAPAITYKF